MKGKRKQAGRAQPQAAPAMPFTHIGSPIKPADLQRQSIIQRQSSANPVYKDVDAQQRLAEISQPPTYPPAAEQYKEGAKKVGEALLKTPLGQQLTDNVKQLGKRFLETLEGKIIGGAVAAGAVTAIIAADEKLPVQAPAIPLDKLAPGLSVQISYEGPARHPTQAMLTFSYTPAAAAPSAPRPPMTDAERFRAENVRLAREQQQFRESLKSPAQRHAEEEERRQRFVQRNDPFNLFDLERIGVHVPANAGASRPGHGRLMRKALRPVSSLAPVVGGAPPLQRAARAEALGGAARGLPLAPA